MEDAFEILGIPRRAALDVDLLESCYRELSKETHPDVNAEGGEKFGKVNAAYATLRSTSSRLKHLRELEFPGVDIERAASMDPGLMELFAKLGPAMQRAEAVAREIREAKSALAKALLADAIWEAREALEEMGAEVAKKIGQQASELERIDAKLAEGERDDALRMIDRNYQTAAFLEKWQGQVREKLMGLMV